jgi:hypothetical protein
MNNKRKMKKKKRWLTDVPKTFFIERSRMTTSSADLKTVSRQILFEKLFQ